jgi:hypothetical protein
MSNITVSGTLGKVGAPVGWFDFELTLKRYCLAWITTEFDSHENPHVFDRHFH